MSIVETNGGPVTHRYLMNKHKSELATNYLQLLQIHKSTLAKFTDAQTREALLERDIHSLRAQLAEYRSAITALDCWMEKHDPKARSDYWRWRHRYHAIVNDARGDHE